MQLGVLAVIALTAAVVDAGRLPTYFPMVCNRAVIPGVDCNAASDAVSSTCDTFGRDSTPCHVLRLHHTAKCVGVDLGESVGDGQWAVSGQPCMLYNHVVVWLSVK